MALDLNRVGFHITIDKNFEKKIKTAMEIEMKIAQRKWGVKLDKEIQAEIEEHAMTQLAQKVSDTSKHIWNFNEIVTIKIKGLSKKGQRDLQLPKDENYSKLKNKKFIQTRDGWEVTEELSDKAITLQEFPDHILDKMVKWASTAVFYGVGSYKS